ncbi:hypothetical protein [Vibrio pectenicida]|uniref:hypothetical protein n=1 Tax=Vibrio pectenicida TaxID=62763 RepID=UPI00148E3FFF|nr:hypothetical protein [Vibrio pectenicida]
MDEIIELETEIETRLSVIKHKLEQAKQNDLQTITIDTDTVEALMSNYNFSVT